MEERKRKRRKKKNIAYDYESAYSNSLNEMNELMIYEMTQSIAKKDYALKEIKAGTQLEVEIYPQFNFWDEVPEAGRRELSDKLKRAQANLNEKNARKNLIRKINANFTDGDLWLTLTYDNDHLPEDGNMNEALSNMQKFIRRVNRRRKKKGLPNAKYIYVTEYAPLDHIRWHHHIVMDGALAPDEVLTLWGQSSRNEARRIQTDENGLTGMAKYIVKQTRRVYGEKRWNSSQGLIEPDIKVTHNKPSAAGQRDYKKIEKYVKKFVRDNNSIEEQLLRWYTDYDFTDSEVFFNDFNGLFYIRARMRKKKRRKRE